MNKASKKIIKATILLLALILLGSSIVNAKPFTDFFKGGLIEVNNFFTEEGFKPYAKTIDFVFFSFLFIAIYMMGVRYAFKEVKKPERAIAVLLGLMSAFLLVLGGWSSTLLLPYIHWILYFLLFLFYWWLSKFIPNTLRWILSIILLILLIIILYSWL